eukprot:1159444-Pelagomonas_calceolata.AAC.5
MDSFPPVRACSCTPAGQTVSEGGFDANRVSNAALLGVATEKDKKGKTYYKFEILTRTGAWG